MLPGRQIHNHSRGIPTSQDRAGLETQRIESPELIAAGLDVHQTIVDIFWDGEAVAFVILARLHHEALIFGEIDGFPART